MEHQITENQICECQDCIEKKNSLLSALDQLRLTCEIPNLYLSNYFCDLRNQVDKSFAPFQFSRDHGDELRLKSKYIWLKIINRIYSFEKELFKLKLDRVALDELYKQLEFIETMLNNSCVDFNTIETRIDQEKEKIHQFILRNKTVFFIQDKRWEHQLVIINDAHITEKDVLKSRYILFLKKINNKTPNQINI